MRFPLIILAVALITITVTPAHAAGDTTAIVKGALTPAECSAWAKLGTSSTSLADIQRARDTLSLPDFDPTTWHVTSIQIGDAQPVPASEAQALAASCTGQRSVTVNLLRVR